MKAVVFDGRAYAEKKEEEQASKVKVLTKKKHTPKLATILAGNNMASKLYVSLKEKAAKRIGAEVEIYNIKSKGVKPEYITNLIRFLNYDKPTHGVMIQLPLPHGFIRMTDRYIYSILAKKDVDGLKEITLYDAPVAKAVYEILKEALGGKLKDKKIVLMGAKGHVGRKISKLLTKNNISFSEYDSKGEAKLLSKADVVISTAGKPGYIKGKDLKDGVVAIDVGSPEPDFDPSVREKASFVTPVPGGVGPVTISCLLDNLIEATYNR